MPEIKLVDLTKRFGRIVAVGHVNLHIRDGEYFSIVGPSGCGKTTTLRLIAGLLEPDEGQIYIGGKLVADVPPEERGVGFVFQTLALSGGMAQRIALARALATGVSLFLLDEPLASLDARLRLELRHELRRFVKDLGLTAIHVTHDQEEALSISDRVAVMRMGKIEQVGAPEELYYSPKTLFVAGFIGENNFLECSVLEVREEHMVVEARGGYRLIGPKARFGRGDEVVLAIRPEFVVVAAMRAGVGEISGEVESISFPGRDAKLRVRLESGEAISARLPFSKRLPNVGTRVAVKFPPERVQVFPYPERGLSEELKLE